MLLWSVDSGFGLRSADATAAGGGRPLRAAAVNGGGFAAEQSGFGNCLFITPPPVWGIVFG